MYLVVQALMPTDGQVTLEEEMLNELSPAGSKINNSAILNNLLNYVHKRKWDDQVF
jgi:hypothetical protein